MARQPRPLFGARRTGQPRVVSAWDQRQNKTNNNKKDLHLSCVYGYSFIAPALKYTGT